MSGPPPATPGSGQSDAGLSNQTGAASYPDGRTAYFITFRTANDKPAWTSRQLRAFDLATGQTRLIRSFPGTEGGPAAVTFDPTGRYMIVESVVRTGPTTKLALINTATGQLTQLNASWAVDPEIAW